MFIKIDKWTPRKSDIILLCAEPRASGRMLQISQDVLEVLSHLFLSELRLVANIFNHD